MGHIPVAKPSPIPSWRFPRKGFAIVLILAGLVALVVVAATTAYPANPAPVGINGPVWVKALRASKLQVDQPVHVVEYRLWLVRTRSGEVVALSQKEPGRGCTIPWRAEFEFDGHKGWFRDPCSGSTFDMTGVKMFGPSPRGMDRYETRIVNGDIQVRIGKGAVIQGPTTESDYHPHYVD